MRFAPLLLLAFASSVLCLPVHAQQWDGSTDSFSPIYRNGNVGVGTSSPDSPLHLKRADDDILTFQTTDDSWLYTSWLDQTGTRRAWMGLNDGLSTFNIMVEDGTQSINFRGGNVAIGVAGPVPGKLHVQEGPDTARGDGHIRLSGTGSNASLRIGLDTEYSWIQSHSNRPLRINPVGNDLHFALEDNHIGIGTTTPPEKLSVNGRVLAKEVIVHSDWADFVFDDGYDLPTLEEVEAHIRQHGHLPDVPSAEEVKETGVLVGENQARLLQKVEEMTLYLIEIEKRLDALEAENATLKQRLSDQR